MNETLTPQEAARVLATANRWEDRLVHRTEGMTWMVWGLATAGIWTTFAATMNSAVAPTFAGMTLAWGTWVVSASALTYALWRSAALTRPDAVARAPWWEFLVKAGVIVASLLVLHFVLKPETPAYPLAITGVLWGAMASLGRRWSALGRRVGTTIGALVVVGGLALPLVGLDMSAMMLGAAVVSGVVPTLGGLYQTLRG